MRTQYKSRAISAHELMQRMHERMYAPPTRLRRPGWAAVLCRRAAG